MPQGGGVLQAGAAHEDDAPRQLGGGAFQQDAGVHRRRRRSADNGNLINHTQVIPFVIRNFADLLCYWIPLTLFFARQANVIQSARRPSSALLDTVKNVRKVFAGRTKSNHQLQQQLQQQQGNEASSFFQVRTAE